MEWQQTKSDQIQLLGIRIKQNKLFEKLEVIKYSLTLIERRCYLKYQMKGAISLNPKYNTLNIKPTKVLRTSPLIACDDRHLYFKSSQKDSQVKTVRWQDKNIVNCTFLKRYNIILLLCENYRVYALTENLQEITSMTGWQSKHTLAFEYIDEYGILLMIGAETVEVIRVSIDSNIKKTKFLSSMKFSLKKLSPQPQIIATNISWNKGYGLNINENLIYVWSPDSIAFIQLSTQQLLSQSFSLTKKQHPITSCYFSPYFKYTITGTLSGEIRVWRLPLSKKFHHQNVLIHTFQTHVKSIKQIVESKYNQKVILTSGEDLLICVWSLQTFESLRKFEFFGIYNEVSVKSIDEAFVLKDNILGELNFGHSLEFITQVNSNILQVDKQSLGFEGQCLNKSINSHPTITLTLEQNLGLIFDKDMLLEGKELNKMQTKVIYPPLKAKSIKQIISCPFMPMIYYLLAENGQLFKVVVSPFRKQQVGVSSKIQEVYNIEFSLDKQKHPLNQLPSCIGFLEMLPLQFDSEIRDVEDNTGKTQRNTIVEQKAMSISEAVIKYNQLKLMTVGCEKGSLVFLSCLDMTKIYCRLTYHRQRILSVQLIKEYKTTEFNPMNGMIATYCSQNYLKLVKFDYEKFTANCILTYYTGEDIKMIRGFENFMAVVFYKGEFQIAEIDNKGKTQEFCCRRPNLIQNHEGQILSIDYENKMELILTAASDNKIKIWTTKKILLYDILLDDGLMFAFFISKSENKNQDINYQQKKQIKLDEKQKQRPKNQKGDKQKKVITDPIEIKLQQLRNRPKPIPVDFCLIILHGQKLLYFNQIPLSFRPNQIDSYNSNPQLLDDQKITLREVFQSYSQKTVENQEPKSPSIQKKQIQKPIRQKQRLFTEPSPSLSKKNSIKQEKGLSALKKTRFKTQTSIPNSLQQSMQIEPQFFSTQKKKQKKLSVSKGQPSISTIKQILYRPGLVSQSSIDATRRHIKQLQSLKKQINGNRPFLPKINKKKDDIFDQFMKQKLINKNVLTRRDITINRIIMKNIIRDHFVDESKMAGLRLDY